MTGRLVSLGSVLVDVMVELPHLPERGGDVLATGPTTTVGGGFNVLSAAARQGLTCLWVGRHGAGPYGELVRNALLAERVRVVLTPSIGETGVCLVLLEPDGERTFVTCTGVEAGLDSGDLHQVVIEPADLVYVSGYDVGYAVSGPAVTSWVAALGPDVRLVFDPGPLVADLPMDRLAAVLARCDVLSANAREAGLLAGVPEGRGEPDPPDDGALFAALRRRVRAEAVICVRRGPGGCAVQAGAGPIVQVPPLPVSVVDSTGAGDAHTGVLIAGLAAGLRPERAARRANIAAAVAVTRRGPATAPMAAEIDEIDEIDDPDLAGA